MYKANRIAAAKVQRVVCQPQDPPTEKRNTRTPSDMPTLPMNILRSNRPHRASPEPTQRKPGNRNFFTHKHPIVNLASKPMASATTTTFPVADQTANATPPPITGPILPAATPTSITEVITATTSPTPATTETTYDDSSTPFFDATAPTTAMGTPFKPVYIAIAHAPPTSQ
ncbi:unnamed protein product [Schistocephalus solidus]|uniref:Uncharacterized protein n=1 Tax=Schistocephalus solidus TaxID=70667 RepID=A0A183SMC2_SCHSO|nr:unnamed protein product [Schistocephalus solidus]